MILGAVIKLHKTTLKIVFSKQTYLLLSISIFAVMLIILLHAREFLFFSPYLAFQLTHEMILSFILIVAVSGLTGMVLSVSIYRIFTQRMGAKSMSSGMLGSLVGVGTGVCTGCSQIGFAIITTFGAAGAVTLSFLSYYEIPLRMASIAILTVSYFLVARNISSNCKINLSN